MGKHFLWDPVEDNIVKEIDDSGTTIADYTTEPFLYGDLISQHRGGQSIFYHFDGQGSTTSLTNSAATVTDTYAYSAFGETMESSGSTLNPFRFIGKKGYYRNEATGDYLVRRRQFTSRYARWLSFDPLGFISYALKRRMPLLASTLGSISDYIYALNSPSYQIDPSGFVADDLGDCKGKMQTYCIHIIIWSGATLKQTDLNLADVNEMWKKCCIQFKVKKEFPRDVDDTKKDIGDDLIFDKAKDDAKLIELFEESFSKNNCIIINLFKGTRGLGDRTTGETVIGSTPFSYKYAWIVLGDKFKDEATITIAHELGHALKLQHCDEEKKEPGCVDEKFAPCDDDSVMHSHASKDAKKISLKECEAARKVSLFM